MLQLFEVHGMHGMAQGPMTLIQAVCWVIIYATHILLVHMTCLIAFTTIHILCCDTTNIALSIS